MSRGRKCNGNWYTWRRNQGEHFRGKLNEQKEGYKNMNKYHFKMDKMGNPRAFFLGIRSLPVRFTT